MKDLLPLRGIVTVINTPFTSNNLLDIPSLRKNIRYAKVSGVSGLLVPGLASEVFKLDDIEKYKLVDTTLEEANKGKKLIVIGGVYGNNEKERYYNAGKLLNMGCDGILVNIPYENKSKYIDEIKKISKLNPPFLMIQDWSPDGFGIPIEVILKLYEKIDCLRSIKVEVKASGLKYTQLLLKTDFKIHVAGGWAVNQMIEALDRGVHVFMPTSMHEIYTEIYRLHKSSDREGAIKLFHRLLPIIAFSNQSLDISVHFFKRMLYKQGVYSSPLVRKPIMDFDEIHRKISDELIIYAMKIMEEIRMNRIQSKNMI